MRAGRVRVALTTYLMLIALGRPAMAEAADAPPNRVRSVGVASGERCPPAIGDEVVVCYSADEPYRIPKPFRRPTEIPAANQSWVNRAATMDEVSRVAGGLPNTCSVVGTGGQTGCTQAMLRAWTAERRAMEREEESAP